MKKVYLVLCNGIVSDEAYSTVDGALNFIANRYGAPKCLDDAKMGDWIYCFNDFVYMITDVSVVDWNEQKSVPELSAQELREQEYLWEMK